VNRKGLIQKSQNGRFIYVLEMLNTRTGVSYLDIFKINIFLTRDCEFCYCLVQSVNLVVSESEDANDENRDPVDCKMKRHARKCFNTTSTEL